MSALTVPYPPPATLHPATTPADRRAHGKWRREIAPRGAHDAWQPAANRADPIGILRAADADPGSGTGAAAPWPHVAFAVHLLPRVGRDHSGRSRPHASQRHSRPSVRPPPSGVLWRLVRSILGPRQHGLPVCPRSSPRLRYRSVVIGWVAERLKAPVLKTGVGADPPWVRIPPHPPTPNRTANAGGSRFFARGGSERSDQITLRSHNADFAVGAASDASSACGRSA
jgi:hypothetical protein